MIPAALLLLPALALQSPDTARVLQRAQELVYEHYANYVPGNTRPCRGVTFDECKHGDWSCQANFCPQDVPRRRAVLIRELEDLAPAAGNSAWLFEQRVGFAVKHGELERARDIAYSCSNTEWWCMALRGFTNHLLEPGAGLREFERALVLAPGIVRCAWVDVGAVASLELLPDQGSLACGGDAGFRGRFWWLADPLWSREGNERQAEHFARHIMHRMHVGSVRGKPVEDHILYDRSYTEAQWPPHEYVKPYPMTTAQGWTNSRRAITHTFRNEYGATITWDAAPGVYVYGGYSFTPDARRFRAPLESRAEDWEVEWDRRVDRERYIPRERWHNLDQQTAVFRRGARLLFVSAATLPSALNRLQPLEAFLALGRLENLGIVAAPARIDAARVVRARVLADSGSYLASIEVVGPGNVGRARLGAPAPPLTDGFGLSDLAFVDARFETDDMQLDDALLPTTNLPRRRVGLYFEVYGIAEEETIEVELTAERVNRSLLQRIGRVVRLGVRPPLRVTWHEGMGEPDEPVVQRFLSLDLGSIDRGDQLLTLTVRRGDGREASASRLISIR